MSADLAFHDAILCRAIESAGGQVFKTVGDAFARLSRHQPTPCELQFSPKRKWSASPGLFLVDFVSGWPCTPAARSAAIMTILDQR
jgi:hypothetical protein